MSTHSCFEEVTKKAVFKTLSMSITANVFVKKNIFMGKKGILSKVMRLSLKLFSSFCLKYRPTFVIIH